MNDALGQLRLRYAGLRLVQERLHGQVYAGKEFSGADVTVAVLSEQAAADPELRRAFAEAVERHRGPAAPGGPVVHAADVRASLPWAAIRGPAELAEQLVASLGGEPPPDATPVTDPPSVADSPPPPQPPAPPVSQPPAFPPRPPRHPYQPVPARRQSSATLSPLAIIAIVVVGVVMLSFCCAGFFGSL